VTLEGIKEAITQLSEDERSELERWLAATWDSEIEADFSPGGAGMSLLEEVDSQIDAGNFAAFKVTRPRG
jgi:hypothetical protein